MDEGDEYVPQISQLGDYGGMGNIPAANIPSQPYNSMSGGLTPMNNPYEQQQQQQQQHMMMMGQPQPAAPPQKAPAKSRSKKKDTLDPMQSMAAMSNNPMVRPSMQQMGGVYPPAPGQMGMYGGQASQQQSPQLYGQSSYRPSQYPQQQGYPIQQQQMAYPAQRPGYPAASGQPGFGYPGAGQPGGYPHGHPQYPAMRPQYPQVAGQGQFWDPQQQQYFPVQSMHSGVAPSQNPNPPAPQSMPDQWVAQQHQHIYQLEMEMRSMQQRLQQIYQQARTPMIEQELAQLQHRMQFLQSEHHRLQMQLAQSGPSPQSNTQQMLPSSVSSQMVGQQMPSGAMGPPSSHQQIVNIQHPQNASIAPNAPVHVTQSGSQVQVNIKPEQSCRISVIYDENNVDEQKDSVPPEPIPTNSYGHTEMQQQQPTGVPSNSSYPLPTPSNQMQQQRVNGGVENGFSYRNQNETEHVAPASLPSEMPSYEGYPSSLHNQTQVTQSLSNSSDYMVNSQPRNESIDIKPTLNGAAGYGDEIPKTEVPKEECPLPVETPAQIDEVLDDRNIETPPMHAGPVAEDASAFEGESDEMKINGDPIDNLEEKPVPDVQVENEQQQPESVPQQDSFTGHHAGDLNDDEEVVEKCSPATVEMRASEERTPAERTPPAQDVVEDDEQLSEAAATPPLEEQMATTSTEPILEQVAPEPSRVETPVEEETFTNISDTPNDEQKECTPSDITESVEEETFTEPSTPAPEVKKVQRKPAVVKAQKKKKNADDSGDDDEDFIPQYKTKKAPKRASKKEKNEDERSSSKWGQEESFDDDTEIGEDSILTTDSQDTQPAADQLVVEKILNTKMGEGENGEESFLIKWKHKSYMHCEWKTLKELEELDKRIAGKLKRYRLKRSQMLTEPDEEDFNSDYTVVDRVLDVAYGEDDVEYALIKWKSLAYDEVTWESLEMISKDNADKVDLWKKRQKIDKSKVKEKARPKASEWKKMTEDKAWKDGNTLREYQFEGVDWLLYCYYTEQNCILADEMGLGKTVQTITFLSQIYDYGIHGPFLIVVPLSTIQNWVREFETWTDLNAVVYHGSAHSREVLQQYEIFYSKHHSNGNKGWRKNLVKLDALITTFEMVVTDCEFLRKINWRVCVIDEAHRLKNRNCKLLTGGLYSFKMEHRVLLTGTPLQNNIEELFSLLNFLHPLQFASSSDFLTQFGQCQSEDQVQKLQEILKPMMLRRLKEDVEKSLQPKQETIIEVQLSDTQKKYYRAILERNFSHLCKGSSAPSLMNVMMELRKCCNHPFLIQGAEDSILGEMRLLHPEWDDDVLAHKALVQSSGKVVLIEKLLPKLKKDGHKVLVFSQMVKVLDLLEEFLINMNYSFERIDGNVRGDMRQASIDRFSKKDSDRFVFLLCTRAGGLGINLTAADTVIIFDSDWNPQNDLQAQARCHRIGQTKTVKVYRLVTSNTYEREMFDKASLKLGLDKAVLQSTTALRESSTALSKKDVEELLKKGAYGSIMEESNEGSKFSEEDIETILQRRTTTITLEAGQKGSLFSKASFNSTHNKGDDIDIDDPEFWTKWAEKAQVDIEKATATPEGRNLIIQEPRKRTKRFEDNTLKEGEESDGSEGTGKGGRKRGTNAASQPNMSRKRRRGDDEDGDYVNYRPDELAFNKSEYFKVEKVLASWGWGRWAEIKKSGELEVSEMDIMHMSRTLLLHCVREYRGDERVRKSVWNLILPQGAKNNKSSKANTYNEGWAVLPEYNPPNFALDATFQRHVHRHANKLLMKIDQLHHLQKEIIAGHAAEVEAGTDWTKVDISVPTLADPLNDQWDTDCDKCLLLGIYRHGLEGIEQMRADPSLVFVSKQLEPFPVQSELSARFRRLIAVSQRSILDPVYDKPKWSRKEEQEFMRVLRTFGMKDKAHDATCIDWDAFRAFSVHLISKSDEEMQEYLYCVLAMCTKVQGGDLAGMDLKRALSIDTLPLRKAQKLMNRLHLTRKVHTLVGGGLEKHATQLKLCSTDAMPSGWTVQHDKELLVACDEHGIENISANILTKPAFQKIIRPTEKVLLRRVIEVCTTLETGKWNGLGNVETIEESGGEEQPSRTPVAPSRGRGRKRAAADDSKMRAMLQQSMLTQMNDQTLAAAMLQSALFMPGMLGGATGNNANSTATAQLLASMLAMTGAGTSGASTSSQSQQQQQQAAAMATLMALAAASSGATLDADALNLTKKMSSSAASSSTKPHVSAASSSSVAPTVSSSAAQQSASTAATSQSLQPENVAAQLGVSVTDLLVLASLPPETRIPVRHSQTKEMLTGSSAPRLKNLSDWLGKHPNYKIDLNGTGKEEVAPGPAAGIDSSSCSSAKVSNPPTPKAATPRPASKAPTPAPSTPVPAPPPPAKSATSAGLEPGEVPKKSASATATVLASTSDTAVAVFNRVTGEILPVDKWPKLDQLGAWLDTHPTANVHSSCVSSVQQTVVAITHPDRLGGEANSTPSTSKTTADSSQPTTASLTSTMPVSSSQSEAKSQQSQQAAQLEAIQMQMLMQQALLQQSLMGFGAYGMPGTSSSSKVEDTLNPLLMASLMSNPMAMQSLLMDPSAFASMAGMSTTSNTTSTKKSKQPPTSQ